MLALSDKDLTTLAVASLAIGVPALFYAFALWCLLWDEVIWPCITAIWHDRFHFRNDGNQHRHIKKS